VRSQKRRRENWPVHVNECFLVRDKAVAQRPLSRQNPFCHTFALDLQVLAAFSIMYNRSSDRCARIVSRKVCSKDPEHQLLGSRVGLKSGIHEHDDFGLAASG